MYTPILYRLNTVQPLRLIKSIDVENIDARQTLLIFPVDFMRRHSPKHVATFQELSHDTLLVRLVGPDQPLLFRGYKLVTSHKASWASIPRPWLRNLGARVGDKLDLFTTTDPDALLLAFRRIKLT